MKLIMETWRRYLNESNSVIVVDESQMMPKFLTEMTLSEGLLEEEKDPQAISLDELAKIPEQKMQSEYQKMLKGETDDIINTRIEKYDKLSNAIKSKEQERYALTDPEWGESSKNPAGDLIVSLLTWPLKLLKSIFGDKQPAGPSMADKTAAINKDIKGIAKEIRHLLITSYTPIQRELFRAISLFTGANFPTIRNPDNFEPAEAEVLEFINDGIKDVFTPTKETYKKAKVILQKLVNSKIKPTPVWRGIGVAEKSGKHPGLDVYKKGAILDVGNLSSFSTKEKVARGFAGQGDVDGAGWDVILHIPKLQRGVDVNEFSEYEDSEDEIIVSGKFRILKMFYQYPNQREKGQIEISSLQSLKDLKASGSIKLKKGFDFEQGIIFVILEAAR